MDTYLEYNQLKKNLYQICKIFYNNLKKVK